VKPYVWIHRRRHRAPTKVVVRGLLFPLWPHPGISRHEALFWSFT